MTAVERRETEACCGLKQISLRFKASVHKEHMSLFEDAGFSLLSQYVKAGILFIEDKNLSANCPFGQNEIFIKCKTKDCKSSVELIEKIILTSL